MIGSQFDLLWLLGSFSTNTCHRPLLRILHSTSCILSEPESAERMSWSWGQWRLRGWLHWLWRNEGRSKTRQPRAPRVWDSLLAGRNGGKTTERGKAVEMKSDRTQVMSKDCSLLIPGKHWTIYSWSLLIKLHFLSSDQYYVHFLHSFPFVCILRKLRFPKLDIPVEFWDRITLLT